MRRIGAGWVALGLLGSVAWGQGGPPPVGPVPALSEELRRTGPPTDRPADDPGPAPGVGVFFVPGEYVPQGGGVSWRRGFWARLQPGWTWLPERWTRRADGWSFDDGRWIRVRPATAAASPVDCCDDAVVPVATTRAVPMNLAAGYLANPSLGYGWGYPGFGNGGFGVYSPPAMWWGGTGFGGLGPAIPSFKSGYVLSYPFGMGWGFGPWGWW